MSDYDNIEEAYKNAKSTISTIANQQGWSQNQIAIALDDAETAYNEAQSVFNIGILLDTDYMYALWENTVTFDPLNNDVADKLVAESFWQKLYALASDNWDDFPNIADTLAWLASAAHAANTSIEESTANNLVFQGVGTVEQTGEDLAEIAEKAKNTGTDPKFWYGLAAVAALGSIGYFVRAFR